MKKMNLEDISQVIIGASILSTPIAFTEEAWKLGETLPTFNIILLIVLSLLFIGMYIYHGIYEGYVRIRIKVFFIRILLIYILTLLVVTLILGALHRYPFIADPLLSLKRSIVIAFPASMGAVVVDGFDKE